jgi:predicted ATP-grasp superfamily ATP-dependent carboligase
VRRSPAQTGVRPRAIVGSLFDTGLAALRSLARAGVPVVGLDCEAGQPGFKSRFGTHLLCPDPVHEPELLVEYLLELAANEPFPPVLLPASDAWTLFISRNRDQLCTHFRFALPSAQVMEAVVNKRQQYELAGQVGTPLPKTFFPTTLADAEEAAGTIDYPAFLKPYYGHLWRETFGGSHKGFKVHTPAELVERFAEALTNNQPVLIQSIIQGPNTNHFKVCAYLNAAGEPLALFTLRKIRQYPTEFGVGTLVESMEDPTLARLGLDFLQGIGYRGIGSIEFKRDTRDGQLKLIELNPRLWQQNGHATACGINFPLVAYRDLIGDPPAPQLCFSLGTKWLDAMPDLQASWEYFRDGQLTPVAWLRSFWGVKSFATFAFDDPLPFLHNYEYGAKALRMPRYLLKHATSTSF